MFDTAEIDWERVNKFKLAGGLFSVGILENAVIYPLDVAKTNLQAEASRGTRPMALLRTLGIRGLYRGFWISTLGSAPSTIAYVTSYNQFKHFGLEHCDSESRLMKSGSFSFHRNFDFSFHSLFSHFSFLLDSSLFFFSTGKRNDPAT